MKAGVNVHLTLTSTTKNYLHALSCSALFHYLKFQLRTKGPKCIKEAEIMVAFPKICELLKHGNKEKLNQQVDRKRESGKGPTLQIIQIYILAMSDHPESLY